MSINDYLLEFEHLNDRMIQFDLKLPGNILYLRLHKTASLGINKKQMVLPIADDLKYDNMKLVLKRISLRVVSATFLRICFVYL